MVDGKQIRDGSVPVEKLIGGSKGGTVNTTVGDGASTTLTVFHGFGTRDVAVTVREVATNEHVACTVVSSTDDEVELTFAVAPAADSLRVRVDGGVAVFPVTSNSFLIEDHCSSGVEGFYDTKAEFGKIATSFDVAVTAAAPEVGHPGIVGLSTGSEANGGAGWSSRHNAVSCGNGRVRSKVILKTPSTLSDGTDTYALRACINDSTLAETLTAAFNGDGNDGAFFKYRHSLNSGRWQCVTFGGGSSSTADSGVTVAVDTWYVLEVIVESDSSAAYFYINGTLVATITTNVPSGVSESTGATVSLMKEAGTAARVAYVDYICLEASISGSSDVFGPAALETVAGIAKIATQLEVDAGIDDSKIVTPLKLREYLGMHTGCIFSPEHPVPATATGYSAADQNHCFSFRVVAPVSFDKVAARYSANSGGVGLVAIYQAVDGGEGVPQLLGYGTSNVATNTFTLNNTVTLKPGIAYCVWAQANSYNEWVAFDQIASGGVLDVYDHTGRPTGFHPTTASYNGTFQNPPLSTIVWANWIANTGTTAMCLVARGYT